MPYFRKCRPCVLFLAVYVMVVVAYSIYSYRMRNSETLKRLDEKLFLVASGVKHCLPKDFHDKAIGEGDVTPEEDAKNVLALSEYASRMGVKYVYTLVNRGGKCFFTASSCTDQELKKAVETPYFQPYTEAAKATLSAFDSDKTTYATDSDRWGSFRSVLIPERSPKGRLYLTGADICTYQVDALLRRHLLHSIVIAGIFILLALPFILIFIKSERDKINEFESLKDLLHQQSVDKTTKIERKINEFLNK
ncbi:MAG: hypothetical protein KAG97_11380 [Victivallales bacterium]|nr:hypothetical protein [Victivallales bacterium]